MKKFILLLLVLLPLFACAQTERHYLYNIVTFQGDFQKEGLKVKLDNGTTIDKVKNEKGKEIKFKTPAAALMYFFSQGWEMYLSGGTTQGEMAIGYGESKTTSYWILRKPCTKEEFEKAVKEGISE